MFTKINLEYLNRELETLIKKIALKEKFAKYFGEHGSPRIFFAPGRVNLIGEHIDYSGGYVFPCAINLGTYLVIRKREDMTIAGFSENINGEIIEVNLNDTSYHSKRGWMNYIVGVFDTFKKMGKNLAHGFDIFIEGDIPSGAGLSSSASIELVIAYAVNDFYQLGLSKLELAKLCQRSENEFNKVNCGIMDQFAVAFGKKDHAILLDCNSLSYEYIPINLEGKSLVIINTNKERSLADSKYNERRASCEQALGILQNYINIKNLCELAEKDFESLKDYITDGEVLKRATHAVLENERVKKAVIALQNNQLASFAALMKKSHLSLKEDYEVSVRELDVLVELAWSFKGVWGARMTGAGFGGCTVNIVDNNRLENFKEFVSQGYYESTGLRADFYVTNVSDGVHEII